MLATNKGRSKRAPRRLGLSGLFEKQGRLRAGRQQQKMAIDDRLSHVDQLAAVVL